MGVFNYQQPQGFNTFQQSLAAAQARHNAQAQQLSSAITQAGSAIGSLGDVAGRYVATRNQPEISSMPGYDEARHDYVWSGNRSGLDSLNAAYRQHQDTIAQQKWQETQTEKAQAFQEKLANAAYAHSARQQNEANIEQADKELAEAKNKAIRARDELEWRQQNMADYTKHDIDVAQRDYDEAIAAYGNLRKKRNAYAILGGSAEVDDELTSTATAIPEPVANIPDGEFSGNWWTSANAGVSEATNLADLKNAHGKFTAEEIKGNPAQAKNMQDYNAAFDAKETQLKAAAKEAEFKKALSGVKKTVSDAATKNGWDQTWLKNNEGADVARRLGIKGWVIRPVLNDKTHVWELTYEKIGGK